MIDQFGRSIEYLRLSITERCHLRCVYCRADEGLCPKKAELSAQDFFRIAKACSALGINRIRLTGGEPLLRKDILEIVQKLSSISGLLDLSVTTNGQMLADQAQDLKLAGLKRVNISLDSLDPQKYRRITSAELAPVLTGINQALEAQLLPVKINVVLIKGVNDDEVDNFIQLAKDQPLEVRMIELMPMAEFGQDDSLRVDNSQLIAERPYLIPAAVHYTGQPSRDFTIEGFQGRVGFISPISHRFCASCNRIRVMSDGMLRPCLGDNMEISLKEALQSGDDDTLIQTIRSAIYAKPTGHHFERGFVSEKNMARIGG